MNSQWRVQRSREVVDYVVGLGEQGRGIRQILSLLAHYGVPANAVVSDAEPATHTWTAAGHVLVCFVAQEERAIYVAVVEPLVTA